MSRIKRSPGRAIQRAEGRNTRGRVKLYILMFCCLVILISGFFLAARQHFASIDYGIRNSRLRKQLDDLEAEKRRLMVAREISLSPSEIKKAAKKYGMTAEIGEVAAVLTGAKDAKSTGQAPVQLVRPIVSSAPTSVAVPTALVNKAGKVTASASAAKRSAPDKSGRSQVAAVIQNRRSAY